MAVLPVTIGVPVGPDYFRAMGNAMVRVALLDLRRKPGPNLYQSGVRYRRERPGSEAWRLPSQVRASGHGDCEDLTIWRVAELRAQGIPARFDVVRAGPRLWHAVVRLPDGNTEDPSKRLGMRGNA
jgi:hypothetical protein